MTCPGVLYGYWIKSWMPSSLHGTGDPEGVAEFPGPSKEGTFAWFPWITHKNLASGQ